MTHGHQKCIPKVAMQEWSGSHAKILPLINMAGDISRCRFLPLESVINFTENDQNGPFKGSPITRQLAHRTRFINVFPIKFFSSSFMITLGFYSMGHNMSSNIPLGPFFLY